MRVWTQKKIADPTERLQGRSLDTKRRGILQTGGLMRADKEKNKVQKGEKVQRIQVY